MRPLVSVIIQSYNSARYIEKCLDSLFAQNYPNFEVIAIINGSEDGSLQLIKKKYSRVKKLKIMEPGENTFYSRGNNLGIVASQGEYILALNQDTVLEPRFISTLIAEMENDPRLGSVSGKLLHYNYSFDSKTKILDSTGIEMFKTRRLIDRGQWEQDFRQYDNDREIFGASGAAAVYRRSALEAVKLPKLDGLERSNLATLSPYGRGGTKTSVGVGEGFEYFDEDFVAYKEDADLAWRLQLAGFRCRYVPEAVLYHGRTVGRSWPTQLIRFILNRRRQSRLVRKRSFKNHYLMMVKNETKELFWRHILFIFIREILLLVYTIFFEPFQIFALIEFFHQLPEAQRKRKLIMANVKVDPRFLRKLFH